MSDKSTRPLPAVQLADLQGYCSAMREWDVARHRALWTTLSKLAGLLLALWRRLPPE